MDDEFLYRMRREPSPEFAERLRARLERQGSAARPAAGGWPAWRIAAVAAAVTLTTLVPKQARF